MNRREHCPCTCGSCRSPTSAIQSSQTPICELHHQEGPCMRAGASESELTSLSRNDSLCRPERHQPTGTGCCLTPYGAPPDRPDLATYSQDEQFSLGNTPTWDNPDIVTNFFNPFRLLPESQVTIRNLGHSICGKCSGAVLNGGIWHRAVP